MTDTAKTKPATKRPRKMAREPQAGGQGAEPTDAAPPPTGSSTAAKPPQSVASATKAPSKSSLVLGMLGRAQGVTIDQLVAATGWLPHTTRAALTGLKKKGHTITSEKLADGARVYRTMVAAAGPGAPVKADA